MTNTSTSRNSVLNDRHRELGAKFDGDSWNDMSIAWSYSTDPHEEVIATRTRAALYDVSAINIVKVFGPDAESLLDALVSIDVTKLKPGTGRLASEVNAEGALVDDIMIVRDAADRFRVAHGSGATPQNLAELAANRNVTVEADSDVHILSLQGPLSLEILAAHVDCDLAALPYFNHIQTTLFGVPVIISRGGYSGERGYEAQCASKDALMLWDSILEAGKPHGVMAASFDALELTRVEGGLLFFPYDMPEGDTTPWEVNLDWTIDLEKTVDYIGKEALLKLKGRERFKQAGMLVEHHEAVAGGTPIFAGTKQVGVVTSASYSRLLMQSLAMVHLHQTYVLPGTRLTIGSGDEAHAAMVVRTPFYDPLRQRTHPDKQR